MHFLVIQTAFIGDAILVSAVLEKLHHHYPDSSIDLVVRKGNEGLFQGHPYLNRLIVWNKKAGKYKQLIRVIRELRSTKYHYILNFQRFAASGLMTLFAKGIRKYGFHKNPLSLFFSRSFPHAIGNGMHETGRNHQLIADFTDAKPARPKLYPSAEDEDRVKPLQKDSYVCIAPASVWFTKQFPQEKWLALIALLKSARIYLIGGPDDWHYAEAIRKKAAGKRIDNLCGRLSLLQTAALMREATMNYVNDSAPLHIASAMNAAVRAVFLSTVPTFGFGPLSDNAAVIEHEEQLYCRPCGLHGYKRCPEGHFRCAYDIDIQKFLD